MYRSGSDTGFYDKCSASLADRTTVNNQTSVVFLGCFWPKIPLWKSARSLFWLFSLSDGRFFGAQNLLGRFFGYWWLSRLLFRSLFWLFIVEFCVKNNQKKRPNFDYSRFLRLLDSPGLQPRFCLHRIENDKITLRPLKCRYHSDMEFSV